MSENETEAGSPADAENASTLSNRQSEAAIPFIKEILKEEAKIYAINEQAKVDKAPMQQAIKEQKKKMLEETGISNAAASAYISLFKENSKIVKKFEKFDEGDKSDLRIIYDGMGQSMMDLDSLMQAEDVSEEASEE